MKLEPGFFKTVWRLALPIALQSILQASFSVVDQIMIGQLGSVQVAGVGLAGKFASIFTVLVSAVAAVAGIMLAQYLGQRQTGAAARAFTVNLAACSPSKLWAFTQKILQPVKPPQRIFPSWPSPFCLRRAPRCCPPCSDVWAGRLSPYTRAWPPPC